MDRSIMDTGKEINVFRSKHLPSVTIHPQLRSIYDMMCRVCEFFFKKGLLMENPPFRGFLLEGSPGTGKTELAKQVARTMDEVVGNIYYSFIDGGSIAAPRWGEGENNLRDAFNMVKTSRENLESDAKKIILFDDIESLMLARGTTLAQEWHYALNSVLLHELDELNPNRLIVIATTNRPKLVDDAIRSRLYPIEVQPISAEALEEVIKEILTASHVDEEDRVSVLKRVMSQLNEKDSPTIRDARTLTAIVCISEGIWRV